MSHVPMTAGRTMEFSPDALGTIIKGDDDTPMRVEKNPNITFYLRVPNWEDRDMVSLRMYSLGVREVTPEQIQNLVISEIYTIMDEAAADEEARFLEGYWQRQRQHQRDLVDWQEQEAVRRLDERESGMEFTAAPRPEPTVTARESARVNNLVSDVTDGSQRLRDKLADQNLYQRRFGMTLARLQIAGWSGLKTEAVFEGRPIIDAQALSKDTVEGLRHELMELSNSGAAWDELVAECEALYDMPRSTEKNSSSPRESSSPPAGSPTRSTESASSDGSSTSSEATANQPGSSSELTRADTSPPITGAS